MRQQREDDQAMRARMHDLAIHIREMRARLNRPFADRL
jgi:hypothetical protein